MKKTLTLLVILLYGDFAFSQNENIKTEKQWSFGADANFYLFKDDFIFLPVLKADKNKLHLEARYNYEDMETFSGWVGYNISGGDKLEYMFTPMIGGVVGLADGIATGLEFTLTYKSLELYSESEYLFDMQANENNFFYMWTDITYSPQDWLWFGVSGQRTRLYQTDLEIQRGLMVGGALKNWELTGYLYNIGFDDPFALLTLSLKF